VLIVRRRTAWFH